MTSLCLFVVSLLVAAPPDPAPAFTHVRPLDPKAEEALGAGRARSARFRHLVADLEASDLVVHVVTAGTLPFGVAGVTRLVAPAGGYRYVRITIDPALPVNQRAAVLGHELQHACELARTTVVSNEGVRRMYRRIGIVVAGVTEAFETRAAIETGRAVWFELRNGPEPPAPRTRRGLQ